MPGMPKKPAINLPCSTSREKRFLFSESILQEKKWEKHTTSRPLWTFYPTVTRSSWLTEFWIWFPVITALKNVTINEPFFQGHFPAYPIMPGVLIVEAMAQAAGVLALESLPVEKRGAPVFFMGLDKVKFRKPVVPGDQLVFEVQIIKFRSKVVKASGQAFVNENVVAEAELMATLG